MFIHLIILNLLIVSLNSLPTKEYFTKNIQFIHSHLTASQENQTVYLFNTEQLTNNASDVTVELKSYNEMFTISKVNSLAFIVFKAKKRDYHKVCDKPRNAYMLEVIMRQGLQVLNSIQLNVSIINTIPCRFNKIEPSQSAIKLNVEYIFGSANDSIGIIKTDLPRNGIVAIVKVANPNKEPLDVKFTTESNLVSIKKFLANFYMIRLATQLNNIDNQNIFEINLQAISQRNKIQLDSGLLKFKIASSHTLNIQLMNSELTKVNSSFTGQRKVYNYFTSLENSQAFIYQVSFIKFV